MGTQFIHQNTYGIVLTANSKKENSHTVETILAEATRHKENCKHVENPEPPIILHGSIDDIVPACQNWLENTKDPLGKKIRKDANCLIAGVFSCPPEDPEKWPQIRDESIKYLKIKYGKRLKCVLEHEDEPFQSGKYEGQTHNHAHYYIVPEPGEALENIHEGKKAFAEVKKSWNSQLKIYAENPDTIPTKIKEKISTTEPKNLLKVLKKISNANAEMYAFKSAMRKFQDDYYVCVSARLGLTRTGPKRMRLTKEEHNARKREAEENAILLNLAYKSVEDIKIKDEYIKSVFPKLRKTLMDSFNSIFELIAILEKKELTEEEGIYIENIAIRFPKPKKEERKKKTI